MKLFPGAAEFVLFLAGFKGRISVNDCGNEARDTTLDDSHVCANRNLAGDQPPNVLDIEKTSSGTFRISFRNGFKVLTLG